MKASAMAIVRIRKAMAAGQVNYKVIVLKENQRLDRLAGSLYGDGRLWWVIAAASGIGWAWQVPPGTQLRVPTDVGQFMGLI
jgi:nucleoid-associated protein YgaU